MSLSYTLDNSRREYWIEQINSIRTQILRFSLDRIVELNFCNIKKEEFTPVHIVLLASTYCFTSMSMRTFVSVKI